ncbi:MULTISPECIES: alpha-ketoacid dehydrogenase subunit beta [Sphingomonas]|uniref:Pyruvate dehydrogenase E1 component subunit beta n=1 Tax=Sphingomonas bisphenolicum TaxID=296544 RepID=A0ABN5WK69_9SPHN|nr:transketolase C-terminal domain-containing protein [Sphingomonas bisphenolicum]BBF69722.1 pyruvate dehydrogenase E1 component subunit beta [Sphingomonas bisphenolicum]
MTEKSKRMTYLDALGLAQREELEGRDDTIIIGEDIALYAAGGAYGDIHPSRIRSAPISECGFAGMAVGAAITGLRPIVDLTIANFIYLAADPIINQAARLRYMTGGQFKVPVTYRASMWHGQANAAQHSDRPYPMFMNIPGLKIVCPATPEDAKGLLKAAIRDDDPVIVFEDNDLWGKKGDVPLDTEFVVPIGKAKTHRAGSDVSIISISGCLRHALKAADALATEGIHADVIDLRTLLPLDNDAILGTLARTGRVVIVDPAHRTMGAAAEIAAIIVEDGFDMLRKPVKRVVTPDVPIPFSPPMEAPLYPNPEKIAAAVRELM